ncbi:MAG: hypothetical protein WCK11_04050 [Candidatus Falkowbacteria bacterium]
MTSQEFEQFFEAANGAIALDDLALLNKYWAYYNEIKPNVPLINGADFTKLGIKLQWAMLPLLTEAQINDLFMNYIHHVLYDPEFDILEKFKIYMRGVTLYEDRDRIKQWLFEHLPESQARILPETGGEFEASRLSFWLKSIIAACGGNVQDSFKFENFFTTFPQYLKLTQIQKSGIRKLMEFYRYLSVSVFTPEGIDESVVVFDGDDISIHKNGKEEKIDKVNFGEDVELIDWIQKTVQNIESRMNTAPIKPTKTSLEELAIEEEQNNQQKS